MALAELFQLVGDLVALEAGQALQAQVEDGAGLGLGEAIGAVLGDLVARLVDQRDQRRHVARPASRAPSGASRAVVGIGRAADQRDDLVDIGDGDGEADQDMGALARLAEIERCAGVDDLLAEGDEGGDAAP